MQGRRRQALKTEDRQHDSFSASVQWSASGDSQEFIVKLVGNMI